MKASHKILILWLLVSAVWVVAAMKEIATVKINFVMESQASNPIKVKVNWRKLTEDFQPENIRWIDVGTQKNSYQMTIKGDLKDMPVFRFDIFGASSQIVKLYSINFSQFGYQSIEIPSEKRFNELFVDESLDVMNNIYDPEIPSLNFMMANDEAFFSYWLQVKDRQDTYKIVITGLLWLSCCFFILAFLLVSHGAKGTREITSNENISESEI